MDYVIQKSISYLERLLDYIIRKLITHLKKNASGIHNLETNLIYRKDFRIM